MKSFMNNCKLIGINGKWNIFIPSLGALTLWLSIYFGLLFCTFISPKLNVKSNNFIEFND